MPQVFAPQDYSSPFFSATIVTSEGRYPLWINGAASDPASITPTQLTGYSASGAASVSVPTLSYLTDISVEIGLGMVPRITATLAPTFAEARTLLDSTLLEYGGTRLEVQFGYSAGRGSSSQESISPIYVGLLMPPDVSFGSDVSVALTAQGTGGYLLASTGVGGATGIKSREDHIADICQDMGVEWDLQNRSEVIYSGNLTEMFHGKIALVVGKSDKLAVLYELARECGCLLQLSDSSSDTLAPLGSPKKTLRLLPLASILNGEPVATLCLFDYANGAIGASDSTFPILSVSTDHKGIFLGADTKRSIISGLDPVTGEVVKREVGPSQTNVSTVTSGAIGSNTPEAQQSTYTTGETVDQPEFAKKADELFQQTLEGGNSLGIKLEVETIGVPDFVPGQVLYVRGISTRIDSKYWILSLKHSLSSSGYTTGLTLIQDASKYLRDSTGLASPKPNTALPPTADPFNTSGAIQITANPQLGVG